MILSSVAPAINAGMTKVYMVAADFQAPSIAWSISEEMKGNSRQLAFFLMLIWIVYTLSKFALPSKRNAMAQGGGGGGKIAGFLVVIICLLDLDLLKKMVNWGLKLTWQLFHMFGWV